MTQESGKPCVQLHTSKCYSPSSISVISRQNELTNPPLAADGACCCASRGNDELQTAYVETRAKLQVLTITAHPVLYKLIIDYAQSLHHTTCDSKKTSQHCGSAHNIHHVTGGGD